MKNLSSFIAEAKKTIATYVEVIRFLNNVKNDSAKFDNIFCDEIKLISICSYLEGWTGADIDTIHEGFELDPETLEEVLSNVASIGAKAVFMTPNKFFENQTHCAPIAYWRDPENMRWAIYAVGE